MAIQFTVAPCSLPVAEKVCFHVHSTAGGDYRVTAQPVYRWIDIKKDQFENPYKAIAAAGIKSVLCVRDPEEVTTEPDPFDLTESQQCILNGVSYTNASLPHIAMTQVQFNMQAYNAATLINNWTGPLLVHCSTGDRASAAFAVFMITYCGYPNPTAVQFATQLLALHNPQFIAWVSAYKAP